MKLISCHIENFGKLSDFSFEFHDGINYFLEDNGWGKSTLAAFIKVMLYGFENDKKRTELENERKRYTPWQGGNYGGQLTFESNGRRYRVSRLFKSRKQDDIYKVYDVDTGNLTEEFDDPLGESLFNIDVDSFTRTVFIAQQACGTDVTSGIRAKIGNVEAETADLGNYDKAISRLNDRSNKLTPHRKSGAIYQCKEDIAELESSVNQKSTHENNVNEYREKLKSEEQEKERLDRDLASVGNLIQKEGERLSLLRKKDEYDRLVRGHDEAQRKIQELDRLYPSGLPALEEVDAVYRDANTIDRLKNEVQTGQISDDDQKELNRLDSIFSLSIPDSSVIKDVGKAIHNLKSVDDQIDASSFSQEESVKNQKYSKKYAEYLPQEEEINDLISKWDDRQKKDSALAHKERMLSSYKNAASNASNRGAIYYVTLIAGIIFLIGAAVTIAVQQVTPFAILLLLLGFISFAGWLIARNKGHKSVKVNDSDDYSLDHLQKEIEGDQSFIKDVDNLVKTFFQRIQIDSYADADILDLLYDIRQEVKEYEGFRKRSQDTDMGSLLNQKNSLEKQIQDFFSEYGRDMIDPSSFDRELVLLQNEISNYQALCKKKEELGKKEKELQVLLKNVSAFLNKYCGRIDENLVNQVLTVRDDVKKYQNLIDEEHDAAKKLDDFCNVNDVAALLQLEGDAGDSRLHDLTERESKISRQLDDIKEDISGYKDKLENALDELDVISQKEVELEEKRGDCKKMEWEFTIINQTIDYLGRAKDNFSLKYMSAIKDHFDKYYAILSGGDAKEYELDANLNIKAIEHGDMHDVQLLSEGYKDLVGLCRRMAMVDAMYETEKPFLIFDDPFVNLDHTKLEGGLSFIKKVAEDYQVLYFTCHQSRVG